MRQLLFKNLVFLIIFVLIFGWTDFSFSQQEAIESTVKISVCGDGIAEGPEECDHNTVDPDNPDLAGQTCQTLSFDGGTLACNNDCTFDTSACYYQEPPSPPPSGGGGGALPPPETRVVFSGRAYPKSSVTLLRDAQVVATTIAGTDANFKITLSGISAGNYIFSLHSEDHMGLRSNLLTFPISVTANVTTNVSGIFIAPSIDVDKIEVRRGDNITIFGQSAPLADITIQISSEQIFFAKATSDRDGIYLHYFNTVPLEYGSHYAKSSAALEGLEISGFSRTVSFGVGTRSIFKKLPEILIGDLNNDGRVNLIDFSIMAFWYGKPNFPTHVDLNNDGRVNLVDFSIMAYHWTG